MTVLVDTSILGRLANTDDPSHLVAGAAVLEMRRQGETLLTAAQNLIEFRNFATRPLLNNGLALPVSEAERSQTNLNLYSLSCRTRPTSTRRGS